MLVLFVLQVEPYEVNIAGELERQLESVINELGLQLAPPVSICN